MDLRTQQLILDLDSEIEDVRKAAVMWLAQLKDPSVLPHLQKLTADPSPAVQYFVRRAIDELGRLAAEAAPEPAPAPRPTPSVADAAAGQAVDPATLVPLDQLLAGLKNPDVRVRLTAAVACHRRDDPNLLAPMLDTLEAETDPRIIATLVKAVGSFRDPRVLPKLLKMLHHSDARVRSNTVDAAMFLDDPEILSAVSLLASDAASRVRSSVALYLAHRAPDRVQGIVTEMVESHLVWMKDSAIYVMHVLGAPWCDRLLEKLIVSEEGNPALAQKAGLALRQLRQRRAIASGQASAAGVGEGATSAGPGLSPGTAALAAAGASAASAAVATGTSSPSAAAGAPVFAAPESAGAGGAGAPAQPPGPQTSAAGVAGSVEQGQEEALEALRKGDIAARLAALERLKDIADDSARSHIELALRHSDERVREKSAAVLTELARRDAARPYLIRLGTATFQMAMKGTPMVDEVAALVKVVAAMGQQLDRGTRVSQTLAARDARLIELAHTVLACWKADLLGRSPLSDLCKEVSNAITAAQIAVVPVEAPARPAALPSTGKTGTMESMMLSGALLEGVVALAGPAVPGAGSAPAGSGGAPGSATAPTGVSGQPSGKFQGLSQTGKLAIPPPVPALPIRMLSFFKQFWLLVAPVVLLGGVSAYIAVFGRPAGMGPGQGGVARKGGSSHASEAYHAITLGEVLASTNARSFEGRGVRWSGSVKDVVDAQKKVIVECDDHEFWAVFDTPVSDDVASGRTVSVDGVITHADPSQVSVKGARVRVYAQSTYQGQLDRYKQERE